MLLVLLQLFLSFILSVGICYIVYCLCTTIYLLTFQFHLEVVLVLFISLI